MSEKITRGVKRSAEGDKAKQRKKKRQYYQAKDKKKNEFSLSTGMKGILITCPVGKEPKCVMEAYNLLNEFYSKTEDDLPETDDSEDKDDKDEGEEDHDEEEEEGNSNESEEDEADQNDQKEVEEEEESIEDALAKELNELQEERQTGNRVFQSVKTGVKGVLFIKTLNRVDTTKLVNKILESTFTQKVIKSRYINRIIPIEIVSYAKVDKIAKAIENALPKYISKEKVQKFAIAPRHSGSNAVSRDELIPEIGKIIRNQAQTVDFKQPDIVIAIETLLNVTVIGFLKNYEKFDKYRLANLRDALGQSWKSQQRLKEEEEKKKKSVQATTKNETSTTTTTTNTTPTTPTTTTPTTTTIDSTTD